MSFRHLPDFFAVCIGVAAQWSVVRAMPVSRARNRLAAAGTLWIAAGFLFAAPFWAQLFPYSQPWEWVRGMGIIYAILITIYAVLRQAMVRTGLVTPQFEASPQATRREAMAAIVPVAFGGYGVFIEPNQMRLTETRLVVPGLAKDLDGLRIAQITDIHYGAYFGRRDLDRAIDMANGTRANLAVVTGDFISIRRDPLDDCLALLKRLKADAGIYGCLGNHEIAADCEDYATQACARLGIKILRAEQAILRFGTAGLNLAGVDYQRNRAVRLEKAAYLHKPGMMNLLLSHNPDVFPIAVEQGWDVTIAGHTHGGQVDVEILGEHLNPARFFTPYICGTYVERGKSIFVSRGLGTVGAPMRAGAPPEVNLIQLVSV